MQKWILIPRCFVIRWCLFAQFVTNSSHCIFYRIYNKMGSLMKILVFENTFMKFHSRWEMTKIYNYILGRGDKS